MQALLKHSVQSYGPLPSELRPRRVRSFTSSRPSPYPSNRIQILDISEYNEGPDPGRQQVEFDHYHSGSLRTPGLLEYSCRPDARCTQTLLPACAKHCQNREG